jgi:DNA-binding response OmpR family regulator
VPSVLLVEERPGSCATTSTHLRQAGMLTSTVDEHRVLERVAARRPCVVLLDRTSTEQQQLDVCVGLRRAHGSLPILILSALGSVEDRIAGLEAGADDYVVAPANPRELVLRVRGLLRTGMAQPVRELLRDDDLVVDLAARRVFLGEDEVRLTGRELTLLAHLLRHRGRVLARRDLLRAVWGWEHGDTATVTVYVRRLRQKLERDPARPTRLLAVPRVGYRWRSPSPAQAP